MKLIIGNIDTHCINSEDNFVCIRTKHKKNMKKYLLLVSAVSIMMNSQAQDLVSNPSFEVSKCEPTGWAQINRANGWSNGNGGTVDLYSVNSGKCSKNVSIPLNHQGEQDAYDGTSYAGIIAYQADEVASYWPDLWDNQEVGSKMGYGKYSEYITTELSAPLVAGKVYRVTYQVSLSDKSSYAISNLGAYVSAEHPMQRSNAFMEVNPTFVDAQLMTNRRGWMPVTGTFTAKGGENYLTIGVFDHSNMKTQKLLDIGKPDFKRAYYFIDGIAMLPADGIDFNLILKGDNVILTKLNFDTGKSTIRSESFEQLDKFAAWLKGHNSIGVSIDGHTDKSGSDELNLKLSKDRAAAVKAYLVNKGVDGQKLFTRGFGDTQPLDRKDLENNEKNRRVEISLRK